LQTLPQPETQYEAARLALSRWRKRTVALLWITYAGFYLCRVNLPAAQKDLAAAEGFSKRQLGLLLSALKLCYAVGQLLNGFLADRLGPRLILVIGLTASAALNLSFAHASGLRAMALIWAANGYFQACGWTPVVRVIANWFPAGRRDAASGAIGTSYILGSGLSWLLAGHLAERFGWRYAFWVPAWICLAIAVLVWIAVRETPRDVGLQSDEGASGDGLPPGENAVCDATRLHTWGLWLVAFAMFLFNFGYHGVLDWTPHYLADARQLGAGAASAQAFLLPLGGAVGCTVLTVTTRRRHAQLPAGTVAVLLVALAALVYSFPALVGQGTATVTVALALLGALSSVPGSMLACSMATNVVPHDSAATAAGIVDALGYGGSALSGWGSGRIMDGVSAKRGAEAAWRTVWHVWPLGILGAAVLVAVLGRRDRRRESEGKAGGLP
jgi:MFS transporter, OPA family, glycerol-3-phosphate transporter